MASLKLQIKMFCKKSFNIILKNKTLKNKILYILKRDYELNSRQLANIKLEVGDNVGDFIVSLTTFPARIDSVKYALYSILNQTLRAKKILLCLDKNEFINTEIPKEILSLEKYGLEILWNEQNLRQYNKIFPALAMYPKEVIITIDDDFCYPKTLLEGLYSAYLAGNKCSNIIYVQRGRMIDYNNGKIGTFFNWKLIKKSHTNLQNKPMFRIFLEGCGGVLYPPNSLYKDACNKDLFMRLCPKADDIWLWAMAILNKTKICVVKNNLMSDGNAMTVNPYGASLWYDNLVGGNDRQLASLLEHYPEILEILANGE